MKSESSEKILVMEIWMKTNHLSLVDSLESNQKMELLAENHSDRQNETRAENQNQEKMELLHREKLRTPESEENLRRISSMR